MRRCRADGGQIEIDFRKQIWYDGLAISNRQTGVRRFCKRRAETAFSEKDKRRGITYGRILCLRINKKIKERLWHSQEHIHAMI